MIHLGGPVTELSWHFIKQNAVTMHKLHSFTFMTAVSFHVQQQLLYKPQMHSNSIFYLNTDAAELAEEEVNYVSGPRTFGRQETLCCVFYCLYCFVNMHFYMPLIIIAYIKIMFYMSLFYVKA